ncbi:MAG: rod shape-determining protein RodA [Bacteroidales bacterium]
MPLFSNKARKQSKLDWILILLYLMLVLIGWISIYSAVYDPQYESILDYSQRYGKQMAWIITSLLMASVILLLDPKFFLSFAYPIYGITIFLLILVLFVGREVAGSTSWFDLGFIRLQPAEFAKYAVCLSVARYLSSYNANMSEMKTKLKLMLIIAVPVGLTLLQNDTGSALVYAAFMIVFYREGFPGNIFLLGVFIILLFLATLIFEKLYVILALALLTTVTILLSKKSFRNILLVLSIFAGSVIVIQSISYVFENALPHHQRERINVLLGKSTDPLGAEYNVNQSKIAIGSGGFSGKGFLEGTQTKFNFVPEQSTDFIFCTIGEEWGFLGSTLLIVLFFLLLYRIITLAERQRSDFSRIYGYSIASIIFLHFFINIGMTIGFIPVIGIPLPFVSYGGSSLWGFTLLLFTFIKLDAHYQELL